MQHLPGFESFLKCEIIVSQRGGYIKRRELASHLRCKRLRWERFRGNGEGGPDSVIPAIIERESIRTTSARTGFLPAGE